MKRLLILFCLLVYVFSFAISPVRLSDYQTQNIRVEFSGAVKKEGMYEFEPYTTLEEALETVELEEDADLSAFNMQTVLKDKDVIPVPVKEEQGLISINNASEEQLMLLPGVGERTAELIVEYRNTNGFFQQIDDLQEVKGIGPAKLEKMRDWVCL